MTRPEVREWFRNIYISTLRVLVENHTFTYATTVFIPVRYSLMVHDWTWYVPTRFLVPCDLSGPFLFVSSWYQRCLLWITQKLSIHFRLSCLILLWSRPLDFWMLFWHASIDTAGKSIPIFGTYQKNNQLWCNISFNADINPNRSKVCQCGNV